jgi:hypothetical protein
MNQNEAGQITDTWLNSIQASNDIPLFRTGADGVTLDLIQGLIRRSQAFSNRIALIRTNVNTTFFSSNRPDGVLYLIYRRFANGQIEPLYIGETEAAMPNGRLNTLFQGTFNIRFDEGIRSNGHIGNLNEAWLYARKVNQPTKNSYAHWLKAFIGNVLMDPLRLQAPVFVQMEEWLPGSVSIVPALAHMDIRTEEMLRIDLLKQAGRGGSLLNS